MAITKKSVISPSLLSVRCSIFLSGMTRVRPLAFIAVSFLLLSSCVKDVTMDAMEDPEIVVQCVLSDAPVQSLKMTFTKGASSSAAPDQPQAKATLTDLTEAEEVGVFTRAADGSWQLPYAAVPSHRYRLDIDVPGHDPIWAEQTMPEDPSIEARWDSWRENLPQGTKYRNNHGYIFSVGTLHSPVWFYGVDYDGPDSEGELTEYLATDFPEVDRFNEQSSAYASRSVFKSRYFMISSYPDLEGTANHRHYLRFPARDAERTEFLVSGNFHGWLEDRTDFVHSRKRFPELRYFAASEDYDSFLSDTYQLEQASSSDDLSSIFLRDNVYSNIQGAIGIFGAKVERILLWDDERNWGNGPFLFSGLEWEDDPIHASFYGENHYFKDEVEIGNGHWQDHKPFSILHYEVRGGHPDDWAYGIRGYPLIYTHEKDRPSYYYEYRQTIYRIDDEEQLREHGLEGYGTVDFTKKTVLVAYARGTMQPYIPYLFDYWITEDRMNGDRVHILYWVHIVGQSFEIYGFREDAHVLNPTISSRVALVVDKIDESDRVALYWYPYKANPYADNYRHLQDDILPELGIQDFNKLIINDENKR